MAGQTLSDLVIVMSSAFLAVYFPQVSSGAAGGSLHASAVGRRQGGRPKDGEAGTGSNCGYGT